MSMLLAADIIVLNKKCASASVHHQTSFLLCANDVCCLMMNGEAMFPCRVCVCVYVCVSSPLSSLLFLFPPPVNILKPGRLENLASATLFRFAAFPSSKRKERTLLPTACTFLSP